MQRFLIRFTPDKDLIDPETDKIKHDYIALQSDHLRDFSTCLFGIFTLEDHFWQIIGSRESYFNAIWCEGESVDEPSFPKDFHRDDKRGCFFLQVGDFHSKNLPYEKGAEKGEAECQILHTPTRCNFWHFSVRWNTPYGDLNAENLKGKDWVKRFLKFKVRTLIQQKAHINPPQFEPIDELYYLC